MLAPLPISVHTHFTAFIKKQEFVVNKRIKNDTWKTALKNLRNYTLEKEKSKQLTPEERLEKEREQFGDYVAATKNLKLEDYKEMIIGMADNKLKSLFEETYTQFYPSLQNMILQQTEKRLILLI